eukprot:SAG31_NODE_1157_length_9612_cov_6.630401_5_plen_115_part_00
MSEELNCTGCVVDRPLGRWLTISRARVATLLEWRAPHRDLSVAESAVLDGSVRDSLVPVPRQYLAVVLLDPPSSWQRVTAQEHYSSKHRQNQEGPELRSAALTCLPGRTVDLDD